MKAASWASTLAVKLVDRSADLTAVQRVAWKADAKVDRLVDLKAVSMVETKA